MVDTSVCTVAVPVEVIDVLVNAPVVAAFVPHDNVPVQVSEPVDAVPLLLIEVLVNAPVVAAPIVAPDVDTLKYGVVPKPMRTAFVVSEFERHTSPILPFR